MIPYLILSIFIFGINVVPFFMPPTWTILAFFHLHYKLEVIPTVVIGALAATAGRVLLAALSRNILRPFLPKKTKENFRYLGKFVNSHEQLTIPVIIMYAFLPIPSNQVYIAAGLAGVNLWLIAFSFFIGRLISYSFWIGAAHIIYHRLGDVFLRHYSNTKFIAVETSGIILLIAISLIPWKKIIIKLSRHF